LPCGINNPKPYLYANRLLEQHGRSGNGTIDLLTPHID
jgi:hypothetical protein